MTDTAYQNLARPQVARRCASIAATAVLATAVTGANLPTSFAAPAPTHNVAGTTCVEAGHRTVPTLATLTNVALGPTCYWNDDPAARN